MIDPRDENSTGVGNYVSPQDFQRQQEQINRENQQKSLEAINAATPDWLTKNLNRQNPMPWENYLPDEIANSSNSLAANDLAKARTPGYLTGQVLNGVGAASTNNMGAGNSLGAANPMGSAIAKRYQAGLGNKLATIQSQVQASEPTMQSQELNRAAQMFGSDQAIAQANFKEQYNYETQRNQLYNQYKNALSAGTASTVGQVIGGAVAAGTLVISAAGAGG